MRGEEGSRPEPRAGNESQIKYVLVLEHVSAHNFTALQYIQYTRALARRNPCKIGIFIYDGN